VVPETKRLPEAGEHAMGTGVPQSFAVATYVTTAEPVESAVALIVPGSVSTGPNPSLTTTLKLVLLALPRRSDAVHVTSVSPNPNSVLPEVTAEPLLTPPMDRVQVTGRLPLTRSYAETANVGLAPPASVASTAIVDGT
jgi:hypothetical protein